MLPSSRTVSPCRRRLAAPTVGLSAALLLALVGGCGGGDRVDSGATATPATAAAQARAVELALALPVNHLDTTAREPMLVEHPGGILFVAGYQRENPMVEQPPALWRSRDGGLGWGRVDVGTVADGAMGNSDVDLAIAPDGTLYYLTMGFDRTVGEGTHVAVGTSRDLGETWSWSYLSHDRRVDRPWIVVAPDGTAHVIWNDGSGVSYRASRDGGASWSEARRIAPRGGSSHLTVGPRGELAVRVTPLSASGAQRDDDAEWILVSEDGGATWAQRAPPGERVFAGLGMEEKVPRWVEPIAWDADGALFYLWSTGPEMRLGRSRDRGVSWQTWTVVRGEQNKFYPYLVARRPGELAATWFSGAGAGLTAHAALIGAAGEEPTVRATPPFRTDSWTPTEPPVRDPAGEYLPIVFLSDGDLAVVSPIQDAAADRYGFTFWRIER